jgi:antitoxin component YwqK of YwqJK toxin-antitoxin module
MKGLLKAPFFWFFLFGFRNFNIGLSARYMKKIFVLISLFFFAHVSAQSLWYFDIGEYSKMHKYRISDVINYTVHDTVNRKDNSGRENGFWQHAVYDSSTKTIFIDRQGRYSYGKKVGQWKYFHPNGNLRGIGTFDEDMLVGNFETYYPNGEVKEKGTWAKTHAIGKHLRFSQGIVIAETDYDASGKIFSQNKFSLSGNIVSKENDSLLIRYYGNGISQSVSHLKDGKLNGYSYEYDENGNLKQKTHHLNGRYDGDLFLYYKNGNIKFHSRFKEGNMFDERMYYDENGKPIEGKFTFYHDNGIKEREGFCKKGKPEGIVTLFNNKGDVIMTADHKDGKPHGNQTYYTTNGSSREQKVYKDGVYVETKMEGVPAEVRKKTGLFK